MNLMSIKIITILLGMTGLIFGGSANAINHNTDASITFDSVDFYRLYGLPSDLLTFSQLRDGTTYSNFNYGSNFFTGITAYEGANSLYYVREDSFSNQYLIRSTNGYGGFKTATFWDGSSVRGDYLISIITPSGSNPFALTVSSESYTGFVGIIPNAVNDSHYLIDLSGPWKIDEIQFGMQALASQKSVPEPNSFALTFAGLILLGIIMRRQNTRLKPTRLPNYC